VKQVKRVYAELRGSRLVATVIVVFVVAAASGAGVWGAFVGQATNAGNSFASGTVALSDNDSGGSMFSLSGWKPGDTASRCIKVTYDGSLTADVRLYGTTTGSGLDPYLGLTVTRGTYSPTEPGFSSCTNFTPDSTTYITGQAAGVVYAGTLQDFPDAYASGIVDPTSGSPEDWTTGEAHVYKFQLAQGDNVTARSKNATQTFTWEARNR
jgi:Camelysin metallo-endopeptidase